MRLLVLCAWALGVGITLLVGLLLSARNILRKYFWSAPRTGRGDRTRVHGRGTIHVLFVDSNRVIARKIG
jgi:hypothetical protein